MNAMSFPLHGKRFVYATLYTLNGICGALPIFVMAVHEYWGFQLDPLDSFLIFVAIQPCFLFWQFWRLATSDSPSGRSEYFPTVLKFWVAGFVGFLFAICCILIVSALQPSPNGALQP